MVQFLLKASLLLLSNLASAAEVSGILHHLNGQMWIEQKSGARLRLQPDNRVIRANLRQLAPEDYLAVSGTILNNDMRVFEVQFVGLKKLLGVWLSHDDSIIDIQSFHHLLWHQSKKSPTTLEAPYKIEYALAPDRGTNWSLFMIRDGKASTGRLRVLKRSIVIETWENGRISQSTRLRRAGAR